MLSKNLISNALIGVVPGFTSADTQVLEAQSLDTILELLTNLRTVEFPCAILEGRSNGAIQLVEGPVDFFTQSVWIMGQFGRGEDESAVYTATYALATHFLAKLIAMRNAGEAALEGWDWRRTQYMKRFGGQNARGWEIVLSFTENISLELPPAQPAPEPTPEPTPEPEPDPKPEETEDPE